MTYICDSTNSDALTYVTSLMYMTRSYAESLNNVTWLTQMLWYMWHYSRTCRNVWLYHELQCNIVMSHIEVILRVKESCRKHEWDYILQKRPIILNSLLIEATPYNCDFTYSYSGVYGSIMVRSAIGHLFLCVTWLVPMYDMHLFLCVTWLLRKCVTWLFFAQNDLSAVQ